MTKFFALADARRVAIIGTGRNALRLVEAACRVRSVESVMVYSRNAERRAAFAQRAQATLGLAAEPVSEIHAATRGAEIIYTATNSLTPVLYRDSLRSGVFVASHGAIQRDRSVGISQCQANCSRRQET